MRLFFKFPVSADLQWRWRGVLALGLLLGTFSSQAQWVTQTFSLTNGWNAVYLHVDASHADILSVLDEDPSNPIVEVWQWRPAPATHQFVQSPQAPSDHGSQWVNWSRFAEESSTLQRLAGNAAYLVRVGTNVSSYVWSLRGKPLPPAYLWTSTGLNFLGFPTPAAQAPSFEQFWAPVPLMRQTMQVFGYAGGPLGPYNPAQVLTFRSSPVRRGEAFWVRSETFNHYFGPFQTVCSPEGVDFGDSSSVRTVRLRNLTSTPLTINASFVASEPAPTGQPAVQGAPPIVLRGPLHSNALTYASIPLSVGSSYSWTLAPQGQVGSELEIFVGLNRAQMTGAPGSLFGGVFRLTDSLGLSQIDLPVSATVASGAGLWVGRAVVGQVGSYLKTYARDEAGQPLVSSNGAYIVTAANTNLGAVPRPFPLQLLVHSPEGGNARLLQRVFYGLDSSTNPIVSTQESVLDRRFLSQSRRLSASHLPWTSANEGWLFNGNLAPAHVVTATVRLDYDDQASNPFLHTYHPDHDNRDASFSLTLPQGSESYSVQRQISLAVRAPGTDFVGITTAGNTLRGDYSEVITVLGLARGGGATDTRRFEVRGDFILNRLLAVPTLTLAP